MGQVMAVTDPYQLFSLLNRLVRAYRIPGAQLAVHHGGRSTVVEAGACRHGAPGKITRDTRFAIGSIGKPLLATIALTLVDDGDIELDEPIAEHLADWAPAPAALAGRLTLRQLLSHTSGLPSSFDERAENSTSVRRYLADNAHRLTLVCRPGTSFSYSNLGYLLVARVIEAITGLEWHTAVSDILLRPLGIEPTFVIALGPSCPAGAVVTGHAVSMDRVSPVAPTLTPAMAPAGALAMSAAELATFGRSVTTGAQETVRGPLTAGTAALMASAVPEAEPFGLADGWGLGLAVYRDGDTEWVGHDGTADGTSCHLRIEPEAGTVVAFTSNANTGADAWEALVSELRATGLPIGNYTNRTRMDQHVPLSPACFGHYINGDTEYSVGMQDDGRPCVRVAGEVFSELRLHEQWSFSVRDPSSGRRVHAGRFMNNPNTGSISGLQTGGRIARRQETYS
jgi:CubicO group peptidase (beta-lactamase class C family)